MTELCCPECGSTELATAEQIAGSASGHAYVDDDGERRFDHDGDTKMFWDVSETVGLECRRCGWEAPEYNLDFLKTQRQVWAGAFGPR